MKQHFTIGIDGSRSLTAHTTGVERYSSCLMTTWKETKVDDGVNLLYYTPAALSEKYIDPTNNIRQRIIPFARLWTQLRLSFEMLRRPPRVLFVPSHTLPLIHPRRSAVMIHDVAFVHFPHSYSTFQYWYLHFSIWFACRFARKILTCSRATADDLQRIYHISPHKIAVIYHGSGAFPHKSDSLPPHTAHTDSHHPPSGAELVDSGAELHCSPYIEKLAALGCRKPFYLFLGRIEEKKNLIRIIQAYARTLRAGVDVDLVLAGGLGHRGKDVLDTIAELGLQNRVFLLGYVDDDFARFLRLKATVLLFTSLYEGFGFPILEAFTASTPVISSLTSSMPEIAGSAALLVDPTSVTDISDAMIRISTDDDLRARLIDGGHQRLKAFSWEKCAQQTYEVLVQLAFEK